LERIGEDDFEGEDLLRGAWEEGDQEMVLEILKAERKARTTPTPPKRAPTATSGKAMRRGNHAPSNDTPSKAPLATAAAGASSWVLSAAPPF
jgi:hypothetical protein